MWGVKVLCVCGEGGDSSLWGCDPLVGDELATMKVECLHALYRITWVQHR